MTNHAARLYALAVTVAVFFVAWAAIAAHPWKTTTAAAQDPRVVRLAAREQKLRHEAVAVQRVVKHRWAVYNRKLKQRQRQNAAIRKQAQLVAAQASAAPQVQVVTLPAVTPTRTS
jgi:hypothetical protein